MLYARYHPLTFAMGHRRSCWQAITQGMRSLTDSWITGSDTEDVSEAMVVSLVSPEMDSWITWCHEQFIVAPHQMIMCSYDRAVILTTICDPVHSRRVMFFDEIHPCLTQKTKHLSYLYMLGSYGHIRGYEVLSCIPSWTRSDIYPSHLISINPLTFNQGLECNQILQGDSSGFSIPPSCSIISHFSTSVLSLTKWRLHHWTLWWQVPSRTWAVS